MTDIADKFKEKLEKSKSKRPINLLILINKSYEGYSVNSDNGDTKVMVSQGNNKDIMGQLKNYLNSFQKDRSSNYSFSEMYGFIQTELTAKEAKLLYGNNLFKDKITLLPGDLTVILKP